MSEKARILVVDDEDTVRDVFAQFIDAKGYAVVTAAAGPDALTAVKHYRPDLVLMDILMPKMSGLEALQRIRQIDPRVGIIMLTAVEDESIAQDAMKQNAYDYITKPVDLGYLELAIMTKLAQVKHEATKARARSGCAARGEARR